MSRLELLWTSALLVIGFRIADGGSSGCSDQLYANKYLNLVSLQLNGKHKCNGATDGINIYTSYKCGFESRLFYEFDVVFRVNGTDGHNVTKRFQASSTSSYPYTTYDGEWIDYGPPTFDGVTLPDLRNVKAEVNKTYDLIGWRSNGPTVIGKFEVIPYTKVWVNQHNFTEYFCGSESLNVIRGVCAKYIPEGEPAEGDYGSALMDSSTHTCEYNSSTGESRMISTVLGYLNKKWKDDDGNVVYSFE